MGQEVIMTILVCKETRATVTMGLKSAGMVRIPTHLDGTKITTRTLILSIVMIPFTGVLWVWEIGLMTKL